jgi:hypothetical protein
MRTRILAVATAATAVAFSLTPALRAQARKAAQEILHQTGNH